MKRLFTTLAGVVALFLSSTATQHIINTGSTSFSPSLTEINFGDTLVFNVGSGHTATEVSQSTWNANGTTSNGGFNLGEGNNQLVTGLSVGTHYYVCQFHVGMGMKAQITVAAAAQVKQVTDYPVVVYPNPARDRIQWSGGGSDIVRVNLLDTQGRKVGSWNGNGDSGSIAVSGLPAGNYFLEGWSEGRQNWILPVQLQ